MTKKHRQVERLDKDEAPIASSDSTAAIPPMERFRLLARRIVRVPREEYADAERQYRETKDGGR
jgi:hypothetical protein